MKTKSSEPSPGLKRLSLTTDRANKLKLIELAEKRGGVLLDVGCGTGDFSVEFGAKVMANTIYGVDIDESALTKAKQRGMRVKRVNLNEKIPLASNMFDTVLCNQSLEHVVNPDLLLEEIYRLLKPEGYLYISVPNLCSLHNRILILCGWQPTCLSPSRRYLFKLPLLGLCSGGGSHLTAFSPLAFKQILRMYDFRVIRYYGSGFYPFRGKLARLISSLLPSLSVLQIIVASKEPSGQQEDFT